MAFSGVDWGSPIGIGVFLAGLGVFFWGLLSGMAAVERAKRPGSGSA